eukprot:CAMPEP_0184298642 /NCGR_PEP_ID=MMETSP1049-20130417/9414_1 /TAXON_ID=77928 /ORGANISM="Proteomonas sulcata, Strain CCMP704" /LENGTH=42 /DNA_ID= /DNA_START= /DNA_END= /DNA_ORIENTATION=
MPHLRPLIVVLVTIILQVVRALKEARFRLSRVLLPKVGLSGL